MKNNMKEISRKEITKTIKGLVREGREWCSYDHFRYYKIMLDTDDGDIWIDVFLDTNEWKRYHLDTIVKLDYFPGYTRETVQGYVDSAIERLEAAGWIITE